MRKTDQDSFIAMVREFLRERSDDIDEVTRNSSTISLCTNLVGEGHVTSLTFMSLVFFLERRLGIEIQFSALSKKRGITIGDLFAAHLRADRHYDVDLNG